MNQGTLAARDLASFATDLDAYRTALRTYLTSEVVLDRWRGPEPATTEERVAAHAALVSGLHRGRWNRYGWPEEVGGLGGDARHRAVLHDELSAAGLPVPEQHLLLETLGPAVLRYAPDLAARFLPACLRADEWWGQGFSESEAGSDLAALRCRARPEGDHFVVSGHKLWTSHGATATRLLCLVRTGSAASRHRGLSMLLVDVAAPGVTVAPVALASGRNELAAIGLDDVIVPRSRLVGPEGEGWAVAMYLLQFERAMYAWQRSGAALRRLRELRLPLQARLAAGHRLPDGARRRVGDVYTDIVTLRARSAETVRRLAAGGTVGPEASVDKVLLAAVETGLHDLARDLLGPQFLLEDTPEAGQWRADWWFSRSATILGGTAEIQRTVLADRVLDLPRETP